MKVRASDSDWLQKADGSSWAAAKAIEPLVGSSDYGATEYVCFGTAYFIQGLTQNWRLTQTFLRFDLTDIKASDVVTAVTLRLYKDTDRFPADMEEFTARLTVLTNSYETCDPTDWGAAGTSSTYSTASISGTDAAGNAYWDFALSAAQVALITSSTTAFDIMLQDHDEVIEPTARNRIWAYSYSYTTTALRPYLNVTAKSLYERILDALITQMQTITANTGYFTTPTTVTKIYKMIEETSESEFPCLYFYPGDEVVPAEGVGTLGADRPTWTIHAGAGIWNSDPSTRAPELLGFIRDVKHALRETPTLGISEVIWARYAGCDIGFLYVIDDNRAAALIHIDVMYKDDLFST